VSLAAAGFVIGVRGGQGSWIFRVVGYVYINGVWCGKWILIVGERGREVDVIEDFFDRFFVPQIVTGPNN